MQPAPAFPGVLVGGRRKVQQQKISGRMNQGDMDVSENSQDIIWCLILLVGGYG